MEKVERSLTAVTLGWLEENKAFVHEALDAVDKNNRNSFYSYPELLTAVNAQKALIFSVGDKEGLCVLGPMGNDLYVHLLYVRRGHNLLVKLSQEIIDIASANGFNGVRFRTERHKAMGRELKQLGFRPLSIEFVCDVGG